MTELLGTYVSEFSGGFPDVPPAPGVDIAGIRADDPDPMYVTLPLLRVNALSQNGFKWEQADVERVVAQINEKRVEGFLGHPTKEERATRYSLPQLRWIGAILEPSSGVAWGKAYVPTYAKDLRDYFRLAKRTNARVGTSVYGVRGENGLSDMSLEEIDLGHSDRLGYPGAAAVPKITSEMTESQPIEEPIMPDNGELKLVSELTTLKDNALRQVSELTTKVSEKELLISEMQKRDQLFKDIEQLIAEIDGETAPAKVKKLVAELAETRKELRKGQVKQWIEAAVSDIELDEVRELVVEQIGDVDSEANAKKVVAELLARPSIKKIAEALALKAGGGRLVQGGKSNTDENDLSKLNSYEAMAEARNRLGV